MQKASKLIVLNAAPYETLEGGYHLGGLTDGIKCVLNEMSGATRLTEEDLRRCENEADPSINRTIESVIGQIKPYWKCFH